MFTKHRRNLFLFGLMGFLSIASVYAGSTPPDAITDLTVSTGSETGSILLEWTATGDDGNSGTASFYEIRYKNGDVISGTTEFHSLPRVDGPPLYVNVSTPQVAGSTESLLVTGLTPGAVFGFAMMVHDDNGNTSTLSNSATAQATLACTQQPNDGNGTAVVAPASVPVGEVVLVTMTYTAAVSDVNPGGMIALRIPDNWPTPSTTTTQGNPGSVKSPTTTGAATLTQLTTNQIILVTVAAGSAVSVGDEVAIYYYTHACDIETGIQMKVFSQEDSCGQLTEIASSPTLDTVVGPPRFIGFDEYPLVVQKDTVATFTLKSRDGCGNPANVTANKDIYLDAQNTQFNPDTDNPLSLTQSPFTGVQHTTVTIPNGQSEIAFYYKTPQTDIRYLQFEYQSFHNSSSTDSITWEIQVLDGGIMNPSVDTGDSSINRHVAFRPNGSPDTVYINFNVEQPSPWEIELSSNGFVDIVERFGGYDENIRVSWDGYTAGSANVPPGIAQPETYRVRISLSGGAITDESLTIELKGSTLIGTIQENGSGNPLEGADVHVWGPSNHHTRTLSDGTFKIHGLVEGTYNIEIKKPGYASINTSFSINDDQTSDLGTIQLLKASTLKLHFTRPDPGGNAPEIWGNITLYNDDWSLVANGQVHFGQGNLASDAGDLYNNPPSSYTTLSLIPNQQYTVKYQIPSHTGPDKTYTLVANETKEETIVLTRRANCSGQVSIPTSDPNGLWISIEAGPDANNDGQIEYDNPDLVFYGGAWMPPGSTQETYNIFGIADGSYLLIARAPGFVREIRNVTIVGSDVTNADFNTFFEGGKLTGTIRIAGDTTGLGTNGTLSVPISARDPVTFVESFTEIQMTENATLTSAVYQLSGLVDGTYEIYVNLEGFETDPPGRILASVVNANGGKDIDLIQHSGSLTGLLHIPSGQNNHNTIDLSLKKEFGGPPSTTEPTAVITGNSYTFSKIGTGFYTLTARYPTTGLVQSGRVEIRNGHETVQTIDLSKPTYAIAGKVSTTASSPYNTLSYLVNSTDQTELYIDDVQTFVNAYRISAVRLKIDDFHDGPPPSNNNNIDPRRIVSEDTFTGFYNTNGDYVIPNVPEGSYIVLNNGELNNDFDDGKEVAEVSQIVHVYDGVVENVNFNIFDGYSISGNLRISNGVSESGRDIDLLLVDAGGTTVAEKKIFVTGTQTAYSLDKIPNGRYSLRAEDRSYPRKYVSKGVSFEVEGGNLSGKEVALLQSSVIQGQFRLASTGELITNLNSSRLPSNFSVFAHSEPWFEGGWGHSDFPLINSDNYFTVSVPPGTFSVFARNEGGFSGEDNLAQGQKPVIPITISGVEVTEGQTTDLGVIDLYEGIQLTGLVTDDNDVPISNMRVEAEILDSDDRDVAIVGAYTDESGKYTLFGIDTNELYEVEANPRESYFQDRSDFPDTGPFYSSVLKLIDPKETTELNFKLTSAEGRITGAILTPDGSPLELPFSENGRSTIGAEVILNKQGTIPTDNPLGDISVLTNPDGTFAVNSLEPGTYDLYALAKGFGAAIVRNIEVNQDSVDIGDIELLAGATLTGTLTKPDGSAPNTSEVSVLVAFGESILIGGFRSDSNGTILDYTLSGFQASDTYVILGFNHEEDLHVLATGVQIDQDTELNLILKEKEPTILPSASKDADGNVVLQLEFSKSLRNSSIDTDGDGTTNDNEQSQIQILSGNGNLIFDDDWIANNRKRASVTYDVPAAGETSFTLRVNFTFTSQDSNTGENHTKALDIRIFTGIGNSKSKKFLNANPSSIQLTGDNSKFSTPIGIFRRRTGSTNNDPDLEVEVIFRSADTTSSLESSAQSASGRKAMAIASTIGMDAYPGELPSALSKAIMLDVSPLSSFYDVFLPATVSHNFSDAAQLCLQYDSSVTDPYSLNIYYYNSESNEYLIENESKSVDIENQRICVNIRHASVFTVLASSDAILTGAAYTGPLNVMNFPNPFNLDSKSLTLQNPGSGVSANQTVSGTMIKMSIPNTMSGDIEIEIYNILGEKVRTLGNNVAGGSHYYMEWDGKNSSGKKVASGTYIARFTIAGSNETFFKMAVVK